MDVVRVLPIHELVWFGVVQSVCSLLCDTWGATIVHLLGIPLELLALLSPYEVLELLPRLLVPLSCWLQVCDGLVELCLLLVEPLLEEKVLVRPAVKARIVQIVLGVLAATLGLGNEGVEQS